jgi:uncharacterized RmlC-like cupin family protein
MAVVERIGADDLQDAAGTNGLRRWVARSGPGYWSGLVETDPNMASAWHHHSDNDTIVYVIEGEVRVEWGKGDDQGVTASAGEFLHVPRNTVHREVNPRQSAAKAVVIRIGESEPVVNVAEPA